MKWYYLLAFMAILFAACEKSYEFSGVIYDAATNKPVTGAKCRLYAFKYDKEDRTIHVDEQIVTTDSTGTYALSHSSTETDECELSVEKLGFMKYYRGFSKSKCEERDIYLYQQDTDLEITFQNLSNSERSVWFGINYDPIGEEVWCGVSNCKPTLVPALGIAKRMLRVPGNVESRIYYLDRHFYVSTGWNHKDVLKSQIYCPRGDTTRLTIEF